MQNTDSIEIPLSRVKLAKFLFFSVLFLILGSWMVVTQPETSNPVFNNPVVKNFAAYGGVIMGLVGILFFSKKLFDKKPGMIIDQEGIIDNTGAVSVGRILWPDILAITENSVQASISSKQRFLVIILRNPEEYISRQGNSLKRRTMSMNLKYAGSPVSIQANGLKISFEELHKLILDRFTDFQARTASR